MISKAKQLQRRWKELIQDLAIQHHVDAKLLLKKIPAFAAEESELARQPFKFIGVPIDAKNVTPQEMTVLKSAADTMAEIMFSVFREPTQELHRLGA